MKKLLSLITLVVCVIAFALPAQAKTLTLELWFEFSEAIPPVSTGFPWLTAIFDDGDTAGSVTLNMEATNLTGVEHIKDWYFNFEEPDVDVSELSFTYVSGETATQVLQNPDPTNNEYKADGDGLFDFMFVFPKPTDPNDSSQGRFGAGETSEYQITGTGITADSFNFLSDSGHKTGYASAAHIGGIDVTKSGWIAEDEGATSGGDPVPEPATMLLFGAGLAGLIVSQRKKLRK